MTDGDLSAFHLADMHFVVQDAVLITYSDNVPVSKRRILPLSRVLPSPLVT